MWPKLTLITAVAGTATALLVADNSPCEQYCGNVLSSTIGSDMVCTDSEYSSSSAGIVFESCIGCELTSAYTSGNESDLQFLLYNLRYQIAYCMFGLENNTNVEDTPCLTNTACGPLEDAIDWRNMSTSVGSYDFCQSWIEDQVPKCTECLTAGSGYFTRNYITILDAACQQMPADGSTLSVQGKPFTTVAMNVTTPSTAPLYTYTPDESAISLGGKVGIAIGALVLLLSVAGMSIVCFGRRRRRAYLKSVEARYGGGGSGNGAGGSQVGWPSPIVGGNLHDAFGTPMSQKPLRGWDDNSPLSATTSEGTEKGNPFPRYFSPYSSQYNSPVSAGEGPPYAAWPTMEAMTSAQGAAAAAAMAAANSSAVMDWQHQNQHGDDRGEGSSSGQPRPRPQQASSPAAGSYTQEEIERMAHEHQLAQIGIAFGGSDPSLRNKNSSASLEAATAAGPAVPQNTFQPSPSSLSSLSSLSVSAGALWEKPIKAKVVTVRHGSSDEAYELREIDSNGVPTTRQSALPTAPVLQHPGYGRNIPYYPRPPSPKMSSPYDGLTEDDARHGHAI